MAEISGFLKDMTGSPVGTTGNPLYVAFSTTAPQTFHFSEPTIKEVEKIVYLVDYRLRPPQSILEKIWQRIGKFMKWVQ